MTGGDNSHRRGPSKRSRTDHLYENSPETSCDNCCDDVSELSYAKLDGCDHTLCFKCFGEAQAARSVRFKMQCPCCNNKMASWNIHSYSSGPTRNAIPQHQPPIPQAIEPPLDESFIKTHPNLYYQHQTPQYRQQYVLLTLAVPSEDGLARVFSVQLRSDGKNDEESERTLEMIYHIGKSLGPCLRPPTNKHAKSNNTFSAMTSVERLEREDKSPLRRFIHGLAEGQALEDDSTGRGAYVQRERNMSFVACEMIRTLKGGGSRHASKLKDLISDSLTVAGVPDFIKDLFSKCGLGKSRNYINLAQDKAVDELIKRGWDPRGRGYGAVVGVYDNIGTRRVKSYVQYTVMAIIFYSVKELIDLKIYPNPKMKDDIPRAKRECLSWVEEDWEVVKTDYEFKIEEKDAELLAEKITIPMIRFVMDAYKDILPSYEQSKQVMDGEDITFTARVSHAVSGRVTMPPPQQQENTRETSTDLCETPLDETDIGDIDELDNEHKPNSGSMYSRNNATVDAPIKEDLNAQKTVMGIINYFCDIRERCLKFTTVADGEGGTIAAANEDGGVPQDLDTKGNPWAEEGWDPSDWPTPWMQGRGVYLCGDGQPTFAMLRLKKTHEDFKDKDFLPFNGGFHTMLETHKLRGKMFGSAHLREIWAHWRSTKAQLDWVMSPGDPNQVEDEMVMYYFGAIAAAIKELIDHREKCNQSTDISAFDVFTYMQDAAQQSPIAQSIYNELRFAEVIFLLQLAEETSDAEMFVTGMKFASLLYTTAHATKYTEIAADFLVWWRCASDADKVFFAKKIMTKKTPTGKSIFADRFVEWMIRDLRGGIGKHYRRGTDAALQRRTCLMSLQKEFENAFKEDEKDNDSSPQSSQRKVGKAFCYTFVYLVQGKLWKMTNQNETSSTSSSTIIRRSIDPDSDFAQISVDMINLPVCGEQRMDQFIHVNNVEDEPEDKEKRTAACLKDVQPTSEGQDNNDKRDLERCISTTRTFLMDSYSKNELVDVYKELKESWPDDNIPKLKGKNKPHYADAVLEARKLLIENDPQWESDTRNKLRQEIADRNASQIETINVRMKEIKEHIFFYLLPETHALRSETTYTVKINVSAPAVDQARSTEEEDLSWVYNVT